MKITTKNYFDTINKIGFENLPLVLKQSHTVILTKTVNGEDWSKYQNDADLKRMIDLVFKKLEEFMVSNKKNLSGTEEKEEEQMEGTKSNANKAKKENPYSKIGTEIKFIHRFLAFHDKILYKNTFEIFIDELQKAIQKKEITKKSPVAKDIIAMQNAVINAFNTMKNAKHFVLKPETIKRYKTIIEKYENAYDDIDDEPTEKKPKRKSIGLNGITENNGKIMSSMDFANMEFSTIGLKDKWLEFIGDPAPGFTAMVYGRPKMGKSYLCVDFAGYLARNHGKVLYVAKEEKLDATLQKKLKDKDVAHPNLFVADNLPKNLSEYQFVILDSVNKLELNPKDLEKLKADNPGVSFIYVFQTTKEGKFRGTNEFQHDVDVIIEVPEKGIAIQNGRFNQGGEMRIFDTNYEDNLSGIQKSKKKVLTKLSSEMEIETELGIPLQELAMELIPPKKDQYEIINLLDHHPEKAEASVKKMVLDNIKEASVDVTVIKVEFKEMDSDNLNHGAAFFTVTLNGTKVELEKIAGDDLIFAYDWETPSVEGLLKKSKHNLTLRNNVSMLDGNNKKAMKKTEAIEKIGKELSVKLEQHSWGELAVLKHGSDWHAILHPEHLEKITTLKKGESCDVDDEQGYKWLITNNGDGYNIKSKFGSNKGHFKIDNKNISANAKWTEPKHLNKSDWHNLKIIKKYCDEGDFKAAMNHAMNCDTVIREEIPPDVWKKMGGQLTKTGEEKLKEMKGKSSPKVVEQIKKPTIVFNHGVRLLKGVIEREWDLELTDVDYIEILDIAQERSSNLPEVINAIHNNLEEFLIIIKKALNEWDKKTGKSAEKSREKFDPKFYANRKDDENPAFIFSLVSSKLLSEALQGDFDLIYLVRKELANRGQDSQGKWVGFEEAKKIHRMD
ncbi:MAG: hypothetical protein Q8T03_07385 [Bacteroidota bacterium]|nr:hypothetical protein [Bacteroidota bacterium]